jgi:hypothetical protein
MEPKKLYIGKILDGLPLVNILSQQPEKYSDSCNLTSRLNIEPNLDLADAVLIPHDIWYLRNNLEYLTYIKKISKVRPTLIFNLGDWPIYIGRRNLIYFQAYVELNLRNKRIIQVPYNTELFRGLKNITVENFSKSSFVGFVPKFGLRRTLNGFKTMPYSPIKSNSFFVRHLMIFKLKRLNNTQIIKRAKFGAAKGFNNKQLVENRKEYINSIAENQFIWCPRGDANQSKRFYEALSAGRVALVPDSNMKYPYYLCNRHKIFVLEVKWYANWGNLLENYSRKFEVNDWQNLEQEMQNIYKFILHYPRFMENVLKEFIVNITNEDSDFNCSKEGGPCRVTYKSFITFQRR